MKMTETVAKQLARLHAELQNLRAQLTMTPTVTKDMSLVSLVQYQNGLAQTRQCFERMF